MKPGEIPTFGRAEVDVRQYDREVYGLPRALHTDPIVSRVHSRSPCSPDRLYGALLAYIRPHVCEIPVREPCPFSRFPSQRTTTMTPKTFLSKTPPPVERLSERFRFTRRTLQVTTLINSVVPQ
jgi:hypothetical protein